MPVYSEWLEHILEAVGKGLLSGRGADLFPGCPLTWHILSFGKCASIKSKKKQMFFIWVLREEPLFEITNGHGIWIFRACTQTRIPGHRFFQFAQASLRLETGWRQSRAAGRRAQVRCAGRTRELGCFARSLLVPCHCSLAQVWEMESQQQRLISFITKILIALSLRNGFKNHDCLHPHSDTDLQHRFCSPRLVREALSNSLYLADFFSIGKGPCQPLLYYNYGYSQQSRTTWVPSEELQCALRLTHVMNWSRKRRGQVSHVHTEAGMGPQGQALFVYTVFRVHSWYLSQWRWQ